jgi:hypothetical protein
MSSERKTHNSKMKIDQTVTTEETMREDSEFPLDPTPKRSYYFYDVNPGNEIYGIGRDLHAYKVQTIPLRHHIRHPSLTNAWECLEPRMKLI